MQNDENVILRKKDKRSRSLLFKHKENQQNNNNNPINFNLIFRIYFIQEKNKINFKKYLIELYHDLSYLSSEEEKGVSKETFFYFLNMPFPIINNIFKLLDKDKNNYLNLEEFLFGMYDIYANNSFNNLTKFVFDLYDTDKDGLISRKDIQLLLNYLPVDKYLRNKYIIKDYINILYIDILENEKMIEKILDIVFSNEFRYGLNYDNFIFIIQNKCSDIFVSVLIYLYETKPFSEDVINIYSYTDYDYLSNNKNSVNFQKIENIFKTKYKNNITYSNNSKENKIEFPTIDLNHNIINRNQPGRFTKKNLNTIFQNNLIEDDINKEKNKKLNSTKHLFEVLLNNDDNEDKIKRSISKEIKKFNSPIINEFYTQKRQFYSNIHTESLDILNKSKNSPALDSKDLLKLDDVYQGIVFKITKKK